MDKASDFESEDCGFDPRQGLAGYFFPSVPGRKWLENIFKIITTGGVRTHAGILPLDLKSNALTTRPPWCWRNGKSDGNHCFHHQQSRASWSFRITRTLLLRYQHKSQANKQTNKETDGQSDEQVDKRKRKQNQERKWTTLRGKCWILPMRRQQKLTASSTPKSSHTGNRTRAAWVKARNPNH